MDNTKPATTKDVARLAGLSKSTVSRVLVGDPHVLPETRQRVETAMREAGFVPNPHARALRNAAKLKGGQESGKTREKGGLRSALRDEWAPVRIMDHHLNLLSDVPNLSETERETIRQGFLGYPSGSSDPGKIVSVLERLWRQYAQRQLMVEQESLQDIEIIRIQGTLDPVNVDVFEKAIRPHCVKGRKLVVDCSGLTNFNSVCLTFLNTYCQEAYRLGGRVAFCCVPPKMEEIIRLLGLHRVLPMYRTMEEAVAFLHA